MATKYNILAFDAKIKGRPAIFAHSPRWARLETLDAETKAGSVLHAAPWKATHIFLGERSDDPPDNLLNMSISSYIKEDLGNRLRTGREAPTPLTLQSLADFYGVSFTPVRAAVSELIEEGVLTKAPNRRLIPNKRLGAASDAGGASAPPEPPTDMFEIIADDLVRQSLNGESVYLREEATAEHYDISRSAIRNIFHRLAGTGLLDHVPRRGWRLRPFRQDDLQAFIEVREVLELKALDLAAPHLVDADLRKMLEDNVVPESENEAPRADNSLHGYLLEKASNVYITDFLERQGRYYRVLFNWESQDRQTIMTTARQHREILQALLKRDWPAARKALAYHIRFNHPILGKVVSSPSNLAERCNGRSRKQL